MTKVGKGYEVISEIKILDGSASSYEYDALTNTNDTFVSSPATKQPNFGVHGEIKENEQSKPAGQPERNILEASNKYANRMGSDE